MAHRRTPRRSEPQVDEPFARLGLSGTATADDVRQARNRLAKTEHPDLGGSHAAMQVVNDAAAAALAAIEARNAATPVPSAPRPAPPVPDDGRDVRLRRDHPSFTIEALPVEAFEALLIAGAVLGQVGDDDPPYRLDVLLDEPPDAWCRLELVPDGGGSTVSLTVSAPGGGIGVAEVRDRFVAELNELAWGDDGPSQPT